MVHRTLIVARMDSADADAIAEIFAESDATDLPYQLGASRRTLFKFHDLYLHLVEADEDFTGSLYAVRDKAMYQDINTKLGKFVRPYDPNWREPKDAMAEPFYTWSAYPDRPEEGRARVAKVARGDVAPNTRRGGDLRVLLSPKTAGTTSGFMGVVTLEPDQFVSEHYHPYSDESIHVVRGSVTMRVNGEPIPLGPEDSLLIPRHVRHRLVNTGAEPAYVVFALSPLAPRPEVGHVDTEPAREAPSHPGERA